MQSAGRLRSRRPWALWALLPRPCYKHFPIFGNIYSKEARKVDGHPLWLFKMALVLSGWPKGVGRKKDGMGGSLKRMQLALALAAPQTGAQPKICRR